MPLKSFVQVACPRGAESALRRQEYEQGLKGRERKERRTEALIDVQLELRLSRVRCHDIPIS